MPSARLATIIGIFLQLWAQYRSQSSVQAGPAPATTTRPQVWRASRVRTTSQLWSFSKTRGREDLSSPSLPQSLTEQQRWRRAQRPGNVGQDKPQLDYN